MASRSTARTDKWVYKPQRPEEIKERAERTGGRFDSIFKSGVDTWRPKGGDNLVRFLPGTWGVGVHYAYDIWVHRFVGADDSTYLCLNKMLKKPCPICAAADEAKRAKDDDEAKALRAVEQRVAWILDRDAETADKYTPKLFTMSWTMDRDILALTHDKRRGLQLYIDDPAEGYDVTIKRSGTGLNTRYFGLAIDREPSPVADKDKDIDKILDFIGEKVIPDILNFYDTQYLDNVLSGTAAPRDELDEDRPARGREEDEPAPRSRRARASEDEKPHIERPRRAAPDDEDTRPRRRVTDEDEAPPPRRRAEPEDERPPRRARPEPEEYGDDEPPPPRRARPEPEDERPPRRREPEDEPPPRRGRAEPDDEDAAPRGSMARGNGRSRGDEDEPPFDDSRPRRRPAEGYDDEPPPRTGRRAEPEDEERRPPRRR